MDPNAVLKELLDALLTLERSGSTDARDEAIERMEDLAEWLCRGGFAPSTANIITQLCEELSNG